MKRFLQMTAIALSLMAAFAFAAPALAAPANCSGDAYTVMVTQTDDVQVLASTAYVQATAAVNVRSGPGTNYTILGKLNAGDKVEKLGVSGTWTKINYNGKAGYVSTRYVKAVSETSATYMQATANVNVRSGPGTGYAKLGQLYKGTIVPKLGTSGSWTKIVYNSQTAYVSTKYLKASSYTGDTGSANSGGSSTSSSGTFNDAAAAKLISIINGYRQDEGIAKLATTAALNKAAKIRVQEIVKSFSHTRPNGTLCFTVDPDNIQGENIAKGSGLPTAQSAADGFMNSQGHRENAMRTSFTKTGAACLKVGATTYWVHLFGY